ncbi:uncharacterized protein L969DRAFT_95854 [Mixia osmundae IAM 14324]|uniref:Histidine kinase n=1 Tax=Mixia osmundae (strain CBS 9802 / IAM 14324 / JCM 22182 / KY 12970) TaxID=764103 RepID=G7DSD3_MIXOS|nr:uncharacterized protein L969DRAFT_95854 [Mixia osmundae IAM 14324]KEI38012.1 hypothetical protein L969DRAFT_95854 [Mixia osmundae IAM 14324]GAA93493.1 hypothetical protein E5Q_00134 [Mixia osmundae IAM 14324]
MTGSSSQQGFVSLPDRVNRSPGRTRTSVALPDSSTMSAAASQESKLESSGTPSQDGRLEELSEANLRTLGNLTGRVDSLSQAAGGGGGGGGTGSANMTAVAHSSAEAKLLQAAFEHLPQPVLIFEPSSRLNFINASARHFFGLKALQGPLAMGYSVSDFFGDGFTFEASQQRAASVVSQLPPSASFEGDDDPLGRLLTVGAWGEEQRIIDAHVIDRQPEKVIATVQAWQGPSDHFATSARPSRQASNATLQSASSGGAQPLIWHTITLLDTLVAPYGLADRRGSSSSIESVLANSPTIGSGASAFGTSKRRTKRAVDRMLYSQQQRSQQPVSGSFFPPVPSPTGPGSSVSGRAQKSNLSERGSLSSGSTNSVSPAVSDQPRTDLSAATTVSSSGSAQYPSVASNMPTVLENASAEVDAAAFEHGIRANEKTLPPVPLQNVAISPGTQIHDAQSPTYDTTTTNLSALSSAMRLQDSFQSYSLSTNPSVQSNAAIAGAATRPQQRPPLETMPTSTTIQAQHSRRRASSGFNSPMPEARKAPVASVPDPPSLLARAALSHLPQTGIITAAHDLSGGFVNNKARELLLGIKAPPEDENGDFDSAWWEEGLWIADQGTSGTWKWDGIEFKASLAKDYRRSEAASTAHASTASSEHGSNETSTGTTVDDQDAVIGPDGELTIGLPTNAFKMTVTAILRKSVSLQQARQRQRAKKARKAQRREAAMQANEAMAAEEAGADGPEGSDGEDDSSQPPVPDPDWKMVIPEEPIQTALRNRQTSSPPTMEHNLSSSMPSQIPGATDYQPHPAPPKIPDQQRPPHSMASKPYKVYDASFGQRILDPFETILELVARKGEHPSSILGNSPNGLLVGVEVEIALDDSPPDEDAFDVAISNDDAAPATASLYATQQALPAPVRRKRFRRRILEVSGAPIFQPTHVGKTHMGGMLVIRDVTAEKKLARRENRQSQRDGSDADNYYKQILDNMPQIVWTTTPLGSHNYFNSQWYAYTGLEPEQSLGLGWQNPFHEDDMPHTIKAWAHSLATGEPYSTEYRCRRHDGVWRWMIGRALPVRDSSGAIIRWAGSCTDANEAISVRTTLAKTQDQFTYVINSADCTLICVDPDRKITFLEGSGAARLNAQGREVTGIDGTKSRTRVGEHFNDVFPPNEEVYHAIGSILDGSSHSARVEVRADDGTWFRLSLTALFDDLRDADGQGRIIGVIIVATDITDAKEAEAALQQSFEERSKLLASETAAKEASRLKSEFVSNLNHEIRSPIAGMIGISELLLDDPTLKPEHVEAVQKIMRSGDILLELVGMVLDMGKVEAGKLELEYRPFLLRDVVADARLFAMAAKKKGLEYLEGASGFYSGEVMGDMARLRQVISNLLSNAIKFTSKGSVKFSLEQVDESDETVVIRFTVKDTGIGIKADAQRLLFQPFHQADASHSRRFGGTGLGLSISRNFAKLMGGTIELESVFGQGTTMTAQIPFPKAPAGLKEPDSPVTSFHANNSTPSASRGLVQAPEAANVHVLLVEDNDINREIVSKLLQRMKFQVTTARDGHEVLELLEQQNFDVCLMDEQMPGMDGLEATRRIRQLSDPVKRRLRIIALTASAISGDRERCMQAGMDDYLAKPVRAALLQQTILRQLHN